METSLDSQIELAIVLHVSHLRQELEHLTYYQLLDILNRVIWKNGRPSSLSEAIGDIYKLKSDDVVRILSTLAQIEGYHSDISDYEELFGGNYEKE